MWPSCGYPPTCSWKRFRVIQIQPKISICLAYRERSSLVPQVNLPSHLRLLKSIIDPILASTSLRIRSSDSLLRPSALITRIGSVLLGRQRYQPWSYLTLIPSTSEYSISENDSMTDLMTFSLSPTNGTFISSVDG